MSDPAQKTDAEWRATLSPDVYRITRQKGTEPPFTGAYVHETTPGTYRCVCCRAPLFGSEAKYDSGSGWPSFLAPLGDGRLRTALDESHGMRRIEVQCRACGAHLGHVFDDGPRPTGKRYCVNSAALTLGSDPADGTGGGQG